MRWLLRLALLPSAWISYGLARWVLSYFDIGAFDRMALAFLAAIVCLILMSSPALQGSAASRQQDRT
jgi:hypothetical protein